MGNSFGGVGRGRSQGPDVDHGSDYARVEKAILFLRERRTQQPDLQEVADHVGLSRFHFHRLFKRWAGTTPKRFLQHLTVEHARSLLAESEPVLQAAFRAGLSGSGRLHDHFVQVEAVTPGEVRKLGSGLRIRFGVHPSPFGDALVAATGRGICFLAFLPGTDSSRRESAEESAVEELRSLWPEAGISHAPQEVAGLARRAFLPWAPGTGEANGSGDAEGAGETHREVLPVHLRGTNFQIQVWRALLRIPPGSVSSYGALARLLDRERAARAVGGAVGANPVALLIPCHRVIRSGGELGGYRWGAARKRAMLARESQGAGPPS